MFVLQYKEANILQEKKAFDNLCTLKKRYNLALAAERKNRAR
jgi:hypothetical protein